MTLPNVPPSQQDDPDGSPEGARPAGRGYWFTPLPTYLLDAVYDPDSPVNAPAAMLWAHIHRHYAWRERIFPSFATLAEETSQGERTVRRLMQALKDAGALTWGATFSSKGRSSNEYALAPVKPFDFDRGPSQAVAAKSGRHSQVAAKSGHHPPVKSDRHPPAKNGRGVKSSSYLESTGESLSRPAVAEPPAAVAEAPEERETATPKDKPTPAAPAEPVADERGDSQSPGDDVAQVLAAYEEALGAKALNGTRAKLLADAAELLAARPLWWVIDRAKELPRYGVDLAKHAAMSKAPVTKPKAASRPAGLPPADPDYVPVQRDMSTILAALRKTTA